MMEQGAISVRACCTHAILSGNAYDKIKNSKITELLVTDSLPLKNNSKKIKAIPIAKLFSDTIKCVQANKSISTNFIC